MFFRSGSGLLIKSPFWMDNLFEKIKLEDLAESKID
jgi:hypothetical protein